MLLSCQIRVRLRAACLAGRVEEYHILHLLSLLPHDGASRAPETPETHCFSVGAYAHGGGIVGIRNNTRLFPEVAKVLTRFVRQQRRNHTFTAVALFRGQKTELHSDQWNEPDSYNLVLPITQVIGGGVWVQDSDGEDQCPQFDCNLPGRILHLPASFKPSRKHCTVPWQGLSAHRVVLVAYTPRGWNSLQWHDQQLLRDAGFHTPRP